MRPSEPAFETGLDNLPAHAPRADPYLTKELRRFPNPRRLAWSAWWSGLGHDAGNKGRAAYRQGLCDVDVFLKTSSYKRSLGGDVSPAASRERAESSGHRLACTRPRYEIRRRSAYCGSGGTAYSARQSSNSPLIKRLLEGRSLSEGTTRTTHESRGSAANRAGDNRTTSCACYARRSGCAKRCTSCRNTGRRGGSRHCTDLRGLFEIDGPTEEVLALENFLTNDLHFRGDKGTGPR